MLVHKTVRVRCRFGSSFLYGIEVAAPGLITHNTAALIAAARLFILGFCGLFGDHNYYREKNLMNPTLDFQLEHYGCERW